MGCHLWSCCHEFFLCQWERVATKATASAGPKTVRSFKAVVEAFLAAHLGGRWEPVGDDFAGSTIEFKVGRELIPGLD